MYRTEPFGTVYVAGEAIIANSLRTKKDQTDIEDHMYSISKADLVYIERNNTITTIDTTDIALIRVFFKPKYISRSDCCYSIVAVDTCQVHFDDTVRVVVDIRLVLLLYVESWQ